MRVAIIDYGMGNIRSVSNAISFLGHSVDIVSQAESISRYDFIILPGVGAFSNAMNRLVELELDIAIREAVKSGTRILGICLGMQLLFSRSYEFGKTNGLDIIKGEVLPFEKSISKIIPHMGWNNVTSDQSNYSAFNGDYYFVHSFYCMPQSDENVLFKSNYGIEFCSAAMIEDQVFGLQFHPEKSQKLGLDLLNKILH